MTTSQALELAQSKELDLVEVSPETTPPVCKLLDYGKLRYEETRAERKARANQKTISIKEIRVSLKISAHDLELKTQQAQRFLGKGHKVLVALRLKGREQAFAERGYNLVQNMIEKIGGKVEQTPNKVGNQITATIAPDMKHEA